MATEITHVILGRFCPIHKGHQMIIDKMIEKFGIENCLLIIGSSTTYNNRTPFTYEARRKMIKKLYPKMRIIGLSDIDPSLEIYDPGNLQNWLYRLKIIEIQFGSKFIFYGGSRADIEYIRKEFKSYVLLNRFKDSMNTSATMIRDALINNDHIKLSDFLDCRIIDLAVSEFKKFHKSSD
jgi:cytidyltransferase-like protein